MTGACYNKRQSAKMEGTKKGAEIGGRKWERSRSNTKRIASTMWTRYHMQTKLCKGITGDYLNNPLHMTPTQDAFLDAHDRERLRQDALDCKNYRKTFLKLCPITGDS